MKTILWPIAATLVLCSCASPGTIAPAARNSTAIDKPAGAPIAGAIRTELATFLAKRGPIERVTAKDPVGFGFGVEAIYGGTVGTIWAYGGETLGYRTLYLYFPTDDLTIAVAVNSAVRPALDTTSNLAVAIYEIVRKHQPLSFAESATLSKNVGDAMKTASI